MRGTRWLLLVAIAAIIFGVGVTYRRQRSTIQKGTLPTPQALPPDVNSAYVKPAYTAKDQATGCIKWEVFPEGMSQAADSNQSQLTNVSLRVFHKSDGECDAKFDLIHSASATFFDSEGRLYSEGDVDITLGEPSEGEPPATLISIHTSGVSYDLNTGRADTDRAVTYAFKNGDGKSNGGTYDPPSKTVFMKHDVVVNWKPVGPHAKAVRIEAPSLLYNEALSEIDLTPSGKMTREDAVFEGESPVIHLKDDAEGHKIIHEIDANKAHGNDSTLARKVAYSADKVWVNYNDEGVMERIVAEGNAVLDSAAETADTHVTAHHVEMFFDVHEKESQLARVTCNGHAVVTSKPLPAPGRQLSETHVLRSESIEMKMRPGGRDIATVSAHPNGTLEFIPNQPAQHHRTLVGDEMLITYGAQNRIDTFRATNVKTTTDPTADEAKRNRTVAVTTSRDFFARFDQQTSQVATIEQNGNFTYQEGDRKALAQKATFDARQNVMNLDAQASVTDSTGSTAADHIRLDERTDDFTAEGNVSSIRQPDKSQKNNSAMLSNDTPLHAKARKMESNSRDRHTRYEGDVQLWQGANTLNGNVVEIDREAHSLVADGNVVTQAWEQPKADEKKKNSTAVLTVVRASHLTYTDTDRLAYYRGGVTLDRPDLHMKSKELHAWMADSKAESQLEKAFADGGVQIDGARRENSYRGTSEHVEYYTTDQKMILNGGAPQLTRSTAGRPPTVVQQPQLILYLNTGNMEGTGAAIDRIPPKKK